MEDEGRDIIGDILGFLLACMLLVAYIFAGAVCVAGGTMYFWWVERVPVEARHIMEALAGIAVAVAAVLVVPTHDNWRFSGAVALGVGGLAFAGYRLCRADLETIA